ncbi:GtrA family protein [Nocardioides sp. Iso805N]|uniref:GtrA family protein n=1 Tax=Nocardioides sp. Iso805N TaxID=1283287 RepID=UPI00037BED76|nr:GtrA family protein [Nocardioides sp. Iso805N]
MTLPPLPPRLPSSGYPTASEGATAVLVRRIGRFVGIGVLNTLLDLALFAVLEPHLGLVPATIVSTGVAMVFSFVANALFAFGATSLTWRAALTFFVPTAINMWVIQPVVIVALNHVAHQVYDHDYLDALAAKLGATVVSLTINFLVYDRYVWPRTSPDPAPRDVASH